MNLSSCRSVFEKSKLKQESAVGEPILAQASIGLEFPSKMIIEEQIAMPRRPTAKSLESLHATLQKLEQASDHYAEDASLSELKQVVLNRIIDLELSKTLVVEGEENECDPGAADLASLPLIREERISETIGEPLPLEKLD
jgi:hypothetical protein